MGRVVRLRTGAIGVAVTHASRVTTSVTTTITAAVATAAVTIPAATITAAVSRRAVTASRSAAVLRCGDGLELLGVLALDLRVLGQA
jgi:phage-related tail protein